MDDKKIHIILERLDYTLFLSSDNLNSLTPDKIEEVIHLKEYDFLFNDELIKENRIDIALNLAYDMQGFISFMYNIDKISTIEEVLNIFNRPIKFIKEFILYKIYYLLR